MTQTIITNATGLKAKRVNPYPKYITPGIQYARKGNPEWEDFEANNPEYDLIEKALPNVELEGELVWVWKHAPKCIFELNIDKVSADTRDRIMNAWQVVSNKEQSPTLDEMVKHTMDRIPALDTSQPVTEESIEEAAEKWFAKNDGIGYSRTTVFIAGANHILNTKGLVDIDKIQELLEDFWEQHQLFPHLLTDLLTQIKWL